MSTTTFSVTVRVWRQEGPGKPGAFADYTVGGVNPDMSFLEMLDVLNDDLTAKGIEPVAFAHDCREGICGTCSLVIDGKPHGPHHGVASCQTYMRSYREGDVIVVEPFRARPFPVIKDLVTDRTAFEKIQQAGGFISIRTGSAPEANSVPVPKEVADLAMDAAQCIGCGACVAACKNASAMLFVAAKVSHLGLLPQGQPERDREGARHGEHDGRPRVRQLHEPVRVQRRLPEADLPRLHRADEPRLREGDLPLLVQAGGRGSGRIGEHAPRGDSPIFL